jgi:hypothetical protein
MTITLFHSHSPLGCPSTIRERDPGDWEKKARVTAPPESRIAAMRAGEKARFRRVGAIAIAALVGLLALGVASPAVAKKKKKKSQPVVSATASAPFNAASGQTLAATCGKGTHISGGGFAVSPNYVPGSGLTGTGLRSGTGTSTPDGAKTWKVASSSWANPAASGTLTAIARCESDSLGKLFATLSSSLSLSPGEGTPLVLNCPNGTHVIAGGYAGDAAGAPAYTAPSFRLIMLQSQRTGPGQWSFTVANNQFSPAAATVTVYAVCEKNAKGVSVSEVGTTVPVAEDQRASADASCTGKTHAISGGFVLSPIPTTSGSIPVTELDEFEPTSKKTWHLGLFEAQGFGVPAGSTVRDIAYCKKDAVSKKKKKK